MQERRIRNWFLRYREREDVEALTRVFDATASRLLALASHLVREADQAEDIVQATFLTAIERRATYDASLSFYPWLAGILIHKAQQWNRRAQRRIEPDRMTERSAAPDPSELVDRLEISETLREAVGELPEKYRRVLRPYLEEGKPPREIARDQGLAPGTVRAQIHRAIDRLRRSLPAGALAGAVWFDTRGLAAVRAEVLREASTAATLAPSAPSSTGASTLAAGLTAKSLALAASALVVAAVAWRLWPDSEPERPAPVASTSQPQSSVQGDVLPSEASATPAERRLVETRGATAPATYTLREASGDPVSGASLALVQDGSAILRGESDPSGELVLEQGREGTGILLVLAPATAPKVFDVSLAPGRHDLVLHEGAAVSGWVLVDGRAPAAPMSLELRSDRQLLGIEEALGCTWEELGLDVDRSSVVDARTDSGGCFRFTGLPPDWSGSLSFPRRFWLRDSALATGSHRENQLGLRMPAEGMSIDLTRRLRLLGRVVRKSGGAAVARADVNPAIQYSGSAPPAATGHVAADAEGRFAILLESPSIAGGSLALSTHDGRLSRDVPLEPRELREDWDLGDLPLDLGIGPLDLSVRVVDTDGAPIAGAVATVFSGRIWASRPTDEAGRTTVTGITPGESTLRVAAKGHVQEEVRAPEEAPDELLVSMRPTSCLELHLLEPGGRAARGLTVVLRAPVPHYAHDRTFPIFRAAWHAGMQVENVLRDGEQWVLGTSLGARDPVILNELVSGVDFVLSVYGSKGGDVLVEERRIAALAHDERRVERIELPRAPRQLELIVLDEQARPLSEARVFVTTPSPYHQRTGTSFGRRARGGRIVFGNLYSEQLDLTVEAPRHLRQHHPRFRLPADGAPVEVRLAPAPCEVRVLVADELGVPVPARIRVELPDGTKLREVPALAPGEYLVRDLPAETITLVANVHQERYERRHDATLPELRITVPVGGVLEALVELPESRPIGQWYSLTLEEAEDTEPDRFVRHELLPARCTSPATVRVEGVVPGRYRVVMRGRDMLCTDPEWEVLTRSTPLVELRAGETSRVTIGPELWLD
jgi:RNA polymerase sigma-70 factor (ECF subfamily)